MRAVSQRSRPLGRTSRWAIFALSLRERMRRRKRLSGTFSCRSRLFAGGEDYAEAGFAAHHAVEGFGGLLELVGFDHGLDAGEGAEVEGVFGVHAGAGGPAVDGPVAEDEGNG